MVRLSTGVVPKFSLSDNSRNCQYLHVSTMIAILIYDAGNIMSNCSIYSIKSNMIWNMRSRLREMSIFILIEFQGSSISPWHILNARPIELQILFFHPIIFSDQDAKNPAISHSPFYRCTRETILTVANNLFEIRLIYDALGKKEKWEQLGDGCLWFTRYVVLRERGTLL